MNQGSCIPSTAVPVSSMSSPSGRPLSTISFLGNGLNRNSDASPLVSNLFMDDVSATSPVVGFSSLITAGVNGLSEDNDLSLNNEVLLLQQQYQQNNTNNNSNNVHINLVNNNSINSILSVSDGNSSSSASSSSFKSHVNSANTSSNTLNPSNSMLDIYTCQSSCAPRAVLTCCSNSHPFEERTLDVTNPVKIGRAVARCKASPNNGIFDCKVLSRNHALFWFEDGKDTKSSNGTFINKQRLSNTNTESTPTEVCSGDIVQFGVDVVENTKRVTHGCVVASIRLYLPSGEEASKSSNVNEDFGSTAGSPGGPNSGVTNNLNVNNNSLPQTITSQQLLQITQCLREALSREEFLTKKMEILENVINNLNTSCQVNWTGLIKEDMLLSRIESLQSKIETLGKCLQIKGSESEVKFLRDQVVRLHDDRDGYESTAKQKIYESKQKENEAVSLANELQVQLKSCHSEIERLVATIGDYEVHVSKLDDKIDIKNKEFEELMQKHSSCDETIKSLQEQIDSLSKSITETLVTKSLENRNHVQEIGEDVISSSTQDKLKIVKQEEVFFSPTDNCAINLNGPVCDQVNDEEVSTKQENERLREKLQEMGSSLKMKEEMVERLSTQLESDKKKHLHQQREFESSQQDILSKLSLAQVSISSLQAVVQSLQKEKESVAEVIQDVKSENEQEGEERRIEETGSSPIDEKVTELTASLQETLMKLESSKQEITELRSKVEDRSQTVLSLQEQISKLRHSLLHRELKQNFEKSRDSAIDNTRNSSEEKETEDVDSITGLESLLQVKEQEILTKEEELINVKSELKLLTESKTHLEENISLLNEELEIVKYQTKIASTCAIVPLLFLILAIFLAFYPTVSTLTGTHGS